MSDIDLEAKFPDLKPLARPPMLGRVLGIGLTLYGSRDHDDETGTFVKTRYLNVLGIPLLALDAYRIGDTPSGWFILGRVPLSAAARIWNCLFLGVLLTLGGYRAWEKYSHSAGYLARQKMAEAERLAEAGQIGQAARLYGEVALGDTRHADAACERILGLLGEPAREATPAEAATAFQAAVALRRRHSLPNDLFQRATDVVNRHAEPDPRGSLLVLNAVAPVAPDRAALCARRQELLERVVSREPDDLEAASELALVYEEEGQVARCEAVLAPHRDRLGTREGARVLGQLYARHGKSELAFPLLSPYVEARLKQMQAAQKAFEEKRDLAQKRIIERIRERNAPGFPYRRFEVSGDDEREVIFREYLLSALKNDPALQEAQDALTAHSRAVPAALDLGMLLLHRANAQTDPAARKADLEKAEKTLLAVRGVAGESRQNRLSLGQVYYWLGKHAEGRKVFDDFLAAQDRSPEVLVAVSHALREVGAVSEARVLAEEAYKKEKDPSKRYHAAAQRAVVAVDLDDRIHWLGLTDPADLNAQALLSNSRGNQALEEGRDDEAAGHFRQAIATFARLPEDVATLNNGANAQSALYHATGDLAALDKRVQWLEKAAALAPGDSIVLSNITQATLEKGLREVIGSSLDLASLKMPGSLDLLSYLYRDRAGRDRWIELLRTNPAVARGLGYGDRLLVLSPRQPAWYSLAASVRVFSRDPEALRALEKRLASVDLDLQDSQRETLERLAGKKDAKLRKEIQAAIARYEKIVQQARQAPGGPTLAVACTHLASQKIELAALGQRVDADRVVALAEEANAAAPSSATQAGLIKALLFRADQALTRDQPEYAAMASRCRRSLGPSYLIAAALSREGKLREAAPANADVRRALALLAEDATRFPEDHGPWAWAMLRGTHPDAAAHLAPVILADEIGTLERAIELRVAPYSAQSCLRAFWGAELAGKQAEGFEALRRCAALGVPIPLDLK